MATKKETNKRVCGFCHQSGHNIRSCEKRKAAEAANGGHVETAAAPAAPVSSTALVPVTAPGGSDLAATTGTPHRPIEFRAEIEQEYIDGTLIRTEVRAFKSGLAEMTLRFTRESTGEKAEWKMSWETASKLHEMLTGSLQKEVARRKGEAEQRTRPNGVGAQPQVAR